MKQSVESLILKEIEMNRTAATHHFGQLYEDFCKLKNLNFNDFSKNQRSLRYYLNNLVKKGILDKAIGGTGFCGGIDWGHTHYTLWAKVGFFDRT